MQDYVGFYWTLPVPWAKHTDLKPDVDAASAMSLTIRYQCARVRQYVAAEKGRLVAEIPFIDVQHDRATDAVRSTLRKHAEKFARSATLIHVRFSEMDHWRPNQHLLEEARTLGFDTLPLPPDPIEIDGVQFDPIRHFKQWRERDQTMKAWLQAQASAGLRAALGAVPPGAGRWRAIADRLNADRIRTVRGAAWTPEAVRKAAGNIETV